MTAAARSIKPKKTTNIVNASAARLTRLGISIWGSRVLYVRAARQVHGAAPR